MVRLSRSKHSFGGSNFHLQFTPKYRRLIFESADVQKTLRNALMNKAKRMGIKIEAMEFGPDHIHVFVTGCKNYSASKLAGQFKGYSSYVIRRKCREQIKDQLWGPHFWSGGYFFESVGRVTGDMVKFYIERQQRKHWQGDDYEYFNVKRSFGEKGQTTLMDFAI